MDHEAAWRLRVGRMDVELRELVRQHERGAAKLQLDVADAPARLDEAELLGGAEDVAVEVNRLLRGLCAQIDKELTYRSEEHTSGLQSLMRISYAVFCLKKKTKQ